MDWLGGLDVRRRRRVDRRIRIRDGLAEGPFWVIDEVDDAFGDWTVFQHLLCLQSVWHELPFFFLGKMVNPGLGVAAATMRHRYLCIPWWLVPFDIGLTEPTTTQTGLFRAPCMYLTIPGAVALLSGTCA